MSRTTTRSRSSARTAGVLLVAVLAGAGAFSSMAAAAKPAAPAPSAAAGGVQGAAASADIAPPAASAPPTHWPLRENRPPVLGEATEPEVFRGYPGAPPYTVVPRQGQLALYPCSQCHKVLPLNATPRKLAGAPHSNVLAHGRGRMWCLDCHTATDRDSLHTQNGTKLDFDHSFQLCGQCHGARQRDWTFGAHGKRVAGWQGERQLYACTHCHDPHNPTLAPRAPGKPPPVRAGLAPMKTEREPLRPPWGAAPAAPSLARTTP